jgi:hypothetical protein
MAASLPRSKSRLTAASALGNLAIFLVYVAATAVFAALQRDAYPFDAVRVESGVQERFWQLKVRRPDRGHLLVLGDSRTNEGVSPRLVAEGVPGFEGKAFNLAFNAGGLNPEVYEFAGRRLARGAAGEGTARIVVLGVTPLSLLSRSSDNEQLHLLTSRSWTTALGFILFPGAMGELLKPELDRTLRIFPGQQEYHDDGWMACERIRDEYPEANLPGSRQRFASSKTSPELIEALYAQTERWTAEGVRVFAFRPPASRTMLEIERKSGFDQEGFVRGFEARGGRWIDIDPEQYRTHDNSHLARAEAERLSRELGARIAAQLDGRTDPGDIRR